MTTDELNALMERTIAGDEHAVGNLFEYVQTVVEQLDMSQLGPYSDDPEYRAEVCARVMGQLLVNKCQRLQQYIERQEHNFVTLIRVMTARVVIALVRSIGDTITARMQSEYGWLRDLTLPPQHGEESLVDTAHLVETYHFMCGRADPLDVELLRLSVQAPEQWLDIAGEHDIEPEAAEQRVGALRQSLRAWAERRAN